LRTSAAILSDESFAPIVHEGLLVSRGMPQFAELDRKARDDIRQFLRKRADDLRKESVKLAKAD